MSKPKKSKVKKSISMILAISLILGACQYARGPSEQSIRDKVVKLSSPHGMCSGEQVHAPSGEDYILTAAHCAILAHDGEIHVTTEDGRQMERRIIAEDQDSDLLLLEGVPGMHGMDIASHSYMTESVRTFTHGHNQDTYRTDGVLVQDEMVDILISEAITPEGIERCQSKPKYQVMEDMCIMHVEETVTTAMVVPGSSGGAAVNDSGELIGVVSAGNPSFGLLVPIQDIRSFLHNY